jgi:hypothetical protein
MDIQEEINILFQLEQLEILKGLLIEYIIIVVKHQIILYVALA